MNQRTIFYTVFLACAMVGLARAEPASVDATAARTELGHFATASVEQLKRAYLECDRRAMDGVLDFDDAARCSMIHEVLKERGFGGDFDRMLAWWKSQKVAAATLLRN